MIPNSASKTLPPMLVSSSPSHDQRILSTGGKTDVTLTLSFTADMGCNSLAGQIKFDGIPTAPSIDTNSVSCTTVAATPSVDGVVPTAKWNWSAKLLNVVDGIHSYTISAPKLIAPVSLMFRVGTPDNILVFESLGNYSTSLLSLDGSSYKVSNSAPGATLLRYSIDYGLTWSDWTQYVSTLSLPSTTFDSIAKILDPRRHLVVQYYSRLAGSATYQVHSEIDQSGNPISLDESYRFPSLNIIGEFNSYGKDGGISASMNRVRQDGKWKSGLWKYPVIYNFPTSVRVDVHNDGVFIFGDVDNDGTLDRLPPNAQGL